MKHGAVGWKKGRAPRCMGTLVVAEIVASEAPRAFRAGDFFVRRDPPYASPGALREPAGVGATPSN